MSRANNLLREKTGKRSLVPTLYSVPIQ